MNIQELLEQYFDVAFAAPDGIKNLRELILSLAMQGKLVPQDNNDQPTSKLLPTIKIAKNKLVEEGKFKSLESELTDEKNTTLFDVHKSWMWCRLDDIAAIARGGSPRPIKSYLTDDPDGLNWIKIGDSDRGKIYINDTREKIKPDGLKNTRMVFPGDLILSNSMSFGYPYILNIQGCIHDGWLIIRTPDKLVDKLFLYYFFLSGQAKAAFKKAASGAVVQNLNADKVRQLLIPLPPIAEQRRIVAKIDELMARCDELEKLRQTHDQKQITVHTAALNQLLTAKDHSDFKTSWHFITQHFGELYAVKANVTELRKAILQLAVMGKLVPQDPNDQPASELLNAIVAEKKKLAKTEKIKAQKLIPPIGSEEITYELPKTWKWVRMDDLCFGITSGSTPPNHIFSDTEGIPFLKVYNIRNQKVDFQYKSQFISEEYHLKSKRSCLKAGDVIMNIVGPPLGKVAIIPDEFPEYNCNQAIVFFRPIIKSLNKYLYLYLLSGKFLDKIDLIGTAGQDNISVTKSRTIPIPLPPLAEQHRIVAKIDQLMTLCDELEKQIDRANGKQTNLLNSVMTKI
jgi:type I restriction enzyme, S subunit